MTLIKSSDTLIDNNWKSTEKYYKTMEVIKQIYHVMTINCNNYTMTTCFKKVIHVTKEFSKTEFDFQFIQHWKSDDCGKTWYQLD